VRLSPELNTELRRRLELAAIERASVSPSRDLASIDRWALGAILLIATTALLLIR